MAIWPQAALCPLSPQDPPPHSMDALTLTPEAWSLPRPPLTHADKWPHSLPPTRTVPVCLLLFVSALPLLIISLIQCILLKCGTASAISWWQVLKFLGSFCIDAVFFHSVVLRKNGVTNKTSERLKEKACLTFFSCFYFVSTSKLLKMEKLQKMNIYINNIKPVHINHIYIRPIVNIILGERWVKKSLIVMHSFKLLFSAISMSTTRPLSDGDGTAQWTKVSKKPFCCQNGSDWSWWGKKDHQKHLFPLQKTHSKHTNVFFPPCQLSVAGEKKIQEWAARWRENRRVETEEAGLSRVVFGGVFVFHTECWLTADGLLSGWSRVKETEGFPPPETLHPPSRITILIPRRGRIQSCEPSGPERFPTPQTLICEEKKMPTASVYRTVSKHS